VILIDANLLLYAYDPRSRLHPKGKAWLEATLSSSLLVRFAWMTLWAFLRISTNPRVFEHPLTAAEARLAISSWLSCPAVGMLDPGERHWEILQGLLEQSQSNGPLVMDAVLAAIAIEHGAELHTTDRDFSRFAGLRWVDPLA
jgi:toxin-antitoxin system PIN domain toxin